MLSLRTKGNSHELGVSRSDHASDAAEPRTEEGVERAVKRVAKRAGGSSLSEVCVKKSGDKMGV